MDPQATFDELLVAIADRDWDRVDDLNNALLGWLNRGGFPPRTLGPDRLGQEWHREIADFVCKRAAIEARKSGNGGVA